MAVSAIIGRAKLHGFLDPKPEKSKYAGIPFFERVKMYAMEDAMAEAQNVAQFGRLNEGMAPLASADDPA